ncbi:MAG: hypothetical protein WAU78_06400 [Roseiarcus sp.]|jgi:hypothetical protein
MEVAGETRCEGDRRVVLSFLRPVKERILRLMTDLLERAVQAVRDLPPEAQDEIARLVLQLAGDDEPRIALTGAERAAIARSKAAAARGEFAGDDEVRAVWAKHGL